MAYFTMRAAPALDNNEALVRVSKPPTDIATSADYFYAVDHPALFHWVNWAILEAAGIEIGPVPDPDDSQSFAWNVEHGRAAPERPVRALRVANAAAIMGALVFIFFLARFLFGGYLWGFVAALPVALSRDLPYYAGGLVKMDAYLAFFIMLVLYVWVRFHYSDAPLSARRLALMGVILGLALSTKLNAGLMLVAYAVYAGIEARGAGRLWRPAAAIAVAAGVFVIVNPVFYLSGHGPFEIIRDILHQRAETYRIHRANLGVLSAWGRITFLFPLWYLMPVMAIVVAFARRQRWFLPAFLWAAFLIGGTAATVTQPFRRYLVPITLALTVLVLFSAIAVARDLHAGRARLRDLLRG